MLKKKLIGIIRWSIRLLFHGYEWLADWRDRLLFRWQRRTQSPTHQREGQCAQTGQCCQAIGLEFPVWWLAWPWWVGLLPKWHALRYNFRFLGRRDNLLVYACNELQADNRCGIHRFKPKLCRDFPQQPLVGAIALHKGCGYRYRALLEEGTPVPAEQRVQLGQSFQDALARQHQREKSEP